MSDYVFDTQVSQRQGGLVLVYRVDRSPHRGRLYPGDHIRRRRQDESSLVGFCRGLLAGWLEGLPGVVAVDFTDGRLSGGRWRESGPNGLQLQLSEGASLDAAQTAIQQVLRRWLAPSTVRFDSIPATHR